MCFKSSSKVPKNLVWNQFCLGSCWLSVGFLDSWNGFAPCSWYDRPDLGCVGAPTWRCCFWLGSINQAVLIDVFCSCSAAFVVFILSGLTMIFMDFEQRLKTIARTVALVSSRTLEGNYAAKVMFNYLTTKKNTVILPDSSCWISDYFMNPLLSYIWQLNGLKKSVTYTELKPDYRLNLIILSNE